MSLMQSALYYGAHAFWPSALLCLWLLVRRRGALRFLAIGVLLLILPLGWARFAEPRLLTVHRETIILPGATDASPSIRIALFGDPHIGIFGNAIPIDRIVRRINSENPDAVFLAGDLTYHPLSDDLQEEFAALTDLDAPFFAVLGNHDVGFPGENLTGPLMRVLRDADAYVVHNRAIEASVSGHDLIIAGSSDLWERRQDFSFSADLPEGVPVFLLTHNPDTALSVPDNFRYDLMLAGHTHGGQVRLPGIYKSFLPVSGPFDKDLHRISTPGGDRLVYVTTGTGMSTVPLRFLMPPRIDILTVHLPLRGETLPAGT